MADANAFTTGRPNGRRRAGMVLAAVLALAMGGGAFHAVHSDLVFPTTPQARTTAANGASQAEYLPLAPITVNIGAANGARHLRMGLTVEVDRRHRAEVERLEPRLIDTLQGYLRALDQADLTGQGALLRIRAQLLRRFQLIAGEGRITDILITDFVLN